MGPRSIVGWSGTKPKVPDVTKLIASLFQSSWTSPDCQIHIGQNEISTMRRVASARAATNQASRTKHRGSCIRATKWLRCDNRATILIRRNLNLRVGDVSDWKLHKRAEH